MSIVVSSSSGAVTPLAGVWIEIGRRHAPSTVQWSLPSRECGLKFARPGQIPPKDASLPSRECGLKSGRHDEHRVPPGVTPLAGVWIEILVTGALLDLPPVTPLAGVWIEMIYVPANTTYRLVTPLAGVWIEMSASTAAASTTPVTPLAGVWIEIDLR